MVNKECVTDVCNQEAWCRGLCRKHYGHALQNVKAESAPTGTRRRPGEPVTLDWLLSRSAKTGDGCIEWTGSRNHEGYGRLKVNGKVIRVHRVAYELAHGKIPDGMVIDHKCRNQSCFNLEHLHAVTPKQNQENSIAEARSTSGIRNVHYCSKGNKPWEVKVRHNGHLYTFGRYRTVEEASRVALAAREDLFTNNLADSWDREKVPA